MTHLSILNVKIIKLVNRLILTGPNAAVTMSGTGRYWVRILILAPTQIVFLKGPMGRCKATIPSSLSLSLTSNLLY